MNDEYEAVFIIKNYEEIKKIKEIMRKIDELVINEGYEIHNRVDYGSKNLVYEIGKEKAGYYYVINFSDISKKKNAKAKIERNINTMEEILQFIIIRNDK